MAVIREYTNYGVSNIPYHTFINDTVYNLRESTKNVTIDGKAFTVKTGAFIGNLNNWFNSMLSTNEYTPTTYYSIKSKNKDRYINFYQSNGTISCTINSNNKPDLGNILPNDTFYSSTCYQNSNPRVVMFEYLDYLLLGWCTDRYGYKSLQAIGLHKDSIEELLGGSERSVYDPEFGGVSDEDGYDPNFDNSSDIISIPNTPSIGVSNVGFVNVYKPTQGALQNLGSDLFPNFEELPEVQPDDDVLVMLSQGFEHLGKNISTLLKSYINSNLINYIIDCHCLPVTPTTGESENIKIGFKSFEQTAQRVTSDYVDFDCGTLNIKEYYGNFIDYIGTRASLYLPFIGFVPIKNEYWQSGTLSVKYRFNVIDGSFMCYVLATSSKSNLKDTVIGTYSGNACVHIPITGVNYANMVSGVVTGGASLIGGVATGNVGLAVSGALNTIASKPQMQSSNSYNSTSSFLGIRYPYLLIEREVSNFSELYPSENGLPLNVTKKIGELTGYIEMDDKIHININCMDEEKQMILDRLTSGIII